jgi:hypothetical protein
MLPIRQDTQRLAQLLQGLHEMNSTKDYNMCNVLFGEKETGKRKPET